LLLLGETLSPFLGTSFSKRTLLQKEARLSQLTKDPSFESVAEAGRPFWSIGASFYSLSPALRLFSLGPIHFPKWLDHSVSQFSNFPCFSVVPFSGAFGIAFFPRAIPGLVFRLLAM